MADQKFPVTSGFYDSVNKDRLYNAEQMNMPYKRVISNGVFATPQGTKSTDLQVVSQNSNRNIIVKKGAGLFADKWLENPADIVIEVPANPNVIPRMDSVIVQVDNRLAERKANIVYREGVAASTPKAPAMNTVTDVKEYRLANVYVGSNANYIGDDAITDRRGSAECPWITSLIQQVDTSTLFNQWQTAYQNYYNSSTKAFNDYTKNKQAEYDAYTKEKKEAFDNFIKSLTDELSVETSVITYENNYTTMAETTTIPIGIPAYKKEKDVLQVYVNRLRATPERDYTISEDGQNITLTNSLQANQHVNFLVIQSIVKGDVETTLQAIQQLNATIAAMKTDSNWISFTLENGVTAFDGTCLPAVRKYGNRVYIHGAVKNVANLNKPICTLPTNMRPLMNHQFTSVAYKTDGSIAGTCVIEVQTAGTIQMIARSAAIAADAKISLCTEYILG